MITPSLQPRLEMRRTEPGLRPAFIPLPRSASTDLAVTPERTQQLLVFLAGLGLDPREPGGPGATAEVLQPIDDALTHTSARRERNHEHLEFLGDAVLRLAAAEYLERRHSRLGVGRRSALRAQLVSDRWLAELGERCALNTVWQIGAIAAGDQAGQATLNAELTEALIGAVYVVWGGANGGLKAVHRWLAPHWQQSSQELLNDPDRHNWKSALQEWSQARKLGLPHYHCQQSNSRHGDAQRFHCVASLKLGAEAEPVQGEGWGRSRRGAEQEAARVLLNAVRPVRDG